MAATLSGSEVGGLSSHCLSLSGELFRFLPLACFFFFCTDLGPTLDIYTNLTTNWCYLTSALLSPLCFPDLGLGKHSISEDRFPTTVL